MYKLYKSGLTRPSYSLISRNPRSRHLIRPRRGNIADPALGPSLDAGCAARRASLHSEVLFVFATFALTDVSGPDSRRRCLQIIRIEKDLTAG